jgi:surfactin synthase thioesterase subunit
VSHRVVWAHDYAESAARMVVIPHAGCGAAPYVKLARRLQECIAIAIIRLPARESRLDEPALTTMSQVVAECADAIEAEVRPPFALLGHCSGAWAAYETAKALADQATGPEVLYVSGEAPPIRRSGPSTDPRDDGQLKRFLQLAGDTSSDVLSNSELLEFVLPALRADLQVVASYHRLPHPALDCPTVVSTLIDNSRPTTATVAGWQAYSSKPVRSLSLSSHSTSLWEATGTLLQSVAVDLNEQLNRSRAE